MTFTRRILGALAVVGLLGTAGLAAQELEATIQGDAAGHPAILRDDIEGEAHDVGHLQPGDPVTVYPQISSPDYYFVKRKGSVPGQGSGWVPRSEVKLARAEDEARQPATDGATAAAGAIDTELGAPPVSASGPSYDAIITEMAANPADTMRRIAESKRSEMTAARPASSRSSDPREIVSGGTMTDAARPLGSGSDAPGSAEADRGSAARTEGVPAMLAAEAPVTGTDGAQPAPADSRAPASSGSDNWDIPKGHWARAAVEELASAGLLRVPNGKFEGETKVNRYEMALLAQRIVAHSRESCTVLAEQLQKLGDASGETRQKVDKLSKRMDTVEHKVAKLATAVGKQGAGANAPEVKELAKNVTSLRQTFTRSIAELALDRSKVEQFHGSAKELLARIDRLEKRVAQLDHKA